MLPTEGLIVLAVGALGLYTFAGVFARPVGFQWLEVAFVYAFPVALLVIAYRQWRRSRIAH